MRWTIGLIGLLLLAGCGKSPATNDAADVRPAGENPNGERAVTSSTPINTDIELAIVDYQGIMELIAEKRGKVVVMDAWATSCPPCMQEFHNLVDIHKQHGPDKVACISLSFDYEGIDKPEDQAPRVLEFLQQEGATFDNLMSTEESDSLYKKFSLAAVPAVFVYDQDGKLRKRFDNEQAKSKEEHFTYDDVKALVAELVTAKPASETAPAAENKAADEQPLEAAAEPTKKAADQ
ncbi:MAG: TlpA disulfide reductase family protein [Pirellulales bacterium]